MKTIYSKALQIVATIYGVFYFLGFALPILMGNYSANHFENITVISMFFLFAIGLGFSWFNSKIGGLLFMLWHLSIWVLSWFFWPDAHMVIVLSLPVLFIGVFMFHNGFIDTSKITLKKHQKQKHLLNLLILNYAVLYSIIIIPAIFYDFNKYMEYPLVFLPLLYLLFLIAFFFSWKKEKLAGNLLIFWYVGVAISSVMYNEIEGPLFIMGLTLFIHGINLSFYKKPT